MIIITYYSTGPLIVNCQFLSHPRNQTVKIGDIAEFECSSHNCDGILRIYVNDVIQVAPRNDLIDILDSREYNATTKCNTVFMGQFWIFINNRTLNTVKSVTCRINTANQTVISYNGYIIAEPTCTPCITEEYPENGMLYTNVTNCSLSDTYESKGIRLKMKFMPLFLLFVSVGVM